MPERLPPRGPKTGEEPTGPEERAREPWEVGPPWERSPAVRPGPTTPLHPAARPAHPERRTAPPELRPQGPAARAPVPEPKAAPGPRPAPVTGAGQFDLFGGKRVAPRPLTVSELSRQLNELLETRFPHVLVEGEVSNLKPAASGHAYFTLKDDEAQVDCVLFKTTLQRLKFRPLDGTQVLVRGRLGFYQGRTRLVCESLEPLGAGALQVAFEQLKARLQAEGLFDAARKRKLPWLPQRIAVVTSPTGAAVHDFIRVLHRRFPNLPVLVVPSKVQGEGAAQELARAIARGAAQPGVDVLVVARGGGSLEDLWAFNEEVVARALAACPVPTVSAVGHEVDFTIADFAADVRAATPTAAAELLARVKEELIADLAQRRGRLVRAVRAALERRRAALDGRRARLLHPRALLAERRLRLDRLEQRLAEVQRARSLELSEELRGLRLRLDAAHPREQLHRWERALAADQERLAAGVQALLARRRQQLAVLAGRLDAMSPLRVLGRGYAVAFDAAGRALRDAADAKPGDALRVRLAKGELAVEVKGVEPGGE